MNALSLKQLQADRRRDPYLQDTSFFSYENFKRVANVAIPFLNLHAPTAKGLSIGFGACNSVVELKSGYQAWRKGEWKACAYSMGKVAFLTVSIAATIVMPIVAIACTQAMLIATETAGLARSIFKRELTQAASSLCSIGSSAVYISAAIYALPELLLLSLVMQGVGELSLSYQEFKQGRYLETVANIILATIRGYGAHGHALTVKRNWWGKQLTQRDWDRLIITGDQEWKKDVDLEKMLVKGNFSSYIRDIHATDQTFNSTIFRNIKFKNCDFTGSRFNKSLFDKVSFQSCQLQRAEFMKALFRATTFQKCGLQDSNFYLSHSVGLQFLSSNLSHAAFNDSSHYKLTLKDVGLEGTSFLQARVKKSSIQSSDLTNCILANCKKQFSYKNCKKHRFTKPVIALTWDFNNPLHYAKKIKRVLRGEGVLVMQFEYSPENVSPEKLANELSTRRGHIEGKEVSFSLADELINASSSYSEMHKMQLTAKTIMESSHGLMISGGKDVETVFYNKEAKVDLLGDHRRSVLELMLIKEARQRGMPLMATCRGAQIVNVYHGGTLKDVGWQTGSKQFEYVANHPKTAYFQELLQSQDLYGFSAHHQAIDRLGKDLEIVAVDQDIPKLVSGASDKSSMLLTQFHPEIWYDIKEYSQEIELFIAKMQAEMERKDSMDWKTLMDNRALMELLITIKKLESHKKFYEHFLAQIKSVHPEIA